MIIVAGQTPQVVGALKPLFLPILPHTTAASRHLFGLLGGICNIYRGPLEVIGTGAAMLAIMLSANLLAVPYLYSLWPRPTACPAASIRPIPGRSGPSATPRSATAIPEDRTALSAAHGRRELGDRLFDDGSERLSRMTDGEMVPTAPCRRALTHRHRRRRHLHQGGADRQCHPRGRRPPFRAHHARRSPRCGHGRRRVFRDVLRQTDVDPAEIIFLAAQHHAGDQCPARGRCRRASALSACPPGWRRCSPAPDQHQPIELAPGRFLRPAHRHLDDRRADASDHRRRDRAS